MSNLHDAARDYAESGTKIFPVIPGTKKPATPHGYKDASADLAQVDAWWTENPDFNIGFCPHDRGLCVIDLDGPEGEAAWTDLQINHGFAPDTWTVQTPHGRHLYFKGELPSSASNLAPHVDTRGRGGYVLLPPSVVDGKVYSDGQ